jgi:trimeric autotransporter adhesin
VNISFKSIWNASLGAWVATSELTSARGKRSRAGAAGPRTPARNGSAGLTAVATGVALVLGWMPAGPAQAVDAFCVSTRTPLTLSGDPSGAGDEVACGEGAVASGLDAVAIGR